MNIYLIQSGEYDDRHVVTTFMDFDRANSFVEIYNINREESDQADVQSVELRDGALWVETLMEHNHDWLYTIPQPPEQYEDSGQDHYTCSVCQKAKYMGVV